MNIKKTLTALFLVAITLFINIHHANADGTTKYWYNEGVNNQWTTLANNWWDDENHTQQSSSLPGSQDDVILLGSTSTAPNVDLDLWQSPNSIDASDTGISFTTQDLSNGVSIDITGDVTFLGFAFPDGDTIHGNAVFNEQSHNGGEITGTATFNNQSYNSSYIDSGAVFNDQSYNQGNVTGTAQFNYAMGGVVTLNGNMKWGDGNADLLIGSDNQPITQWIFKDQSMNSGTIIGDVIFSDQTYNTGTINGIAKFNYASNGIVTLSNGMRWENGTATSIVGVDDIPITRWIFDGDSYNNGTIDNDPVFNDRSYNNANVNSNATFNNHAHNQGSILNNTIFNDKSYNYGGVVGQNATFYDQSFNSPFNGSTVTGIAKFMYATAGIATLSGDMRWSGGNLNSIVGSDDQPITQWVFNYQLPPSNPSFGSMVTFADLPKGIKNLNSTVNFDFSMFDVAGNTCSNCTYNISVNPSETVTSNKTGNQVTGSFVVHRLGLYSLVVTISDGSHTMTKNYSFFVGTIGLNISSSTARYYLRRAYPANEEPKRGNGNDSGSLLLTAATTTEINFCSDWGQDSIDELPTNVPYSSLISDLGMHVWYLANNPGDIGMERYFSYSEDIDVQNSVSSHLSYSPVDSSFSDVNWTLNSPQEWYGVTFKLISPNGFPKFRSTQTNPSYIDLTYDYTTSPFVKETGIKSDMILLSATASSTASTTSASLSFYNPFVVATSTTINIGGLKSNSDFEVVVNDVRMGSYMTDPNGELDVVLNLPASAVSTVDLNAIPVISSIVSGTPSQSDVVISWTTDVVSDSQVEYGFTSSYIASTTLDATLTISHAMSLSGLMPGTLYHYRIISKNSNGNSVISSDQTFTTATSQSNGSSGGSSSGSSGPSGGSSYGGSSIVSNPVIPVSITPSVTTLSFTRPLTVSSQGSDVIALQQFLVVKGYLVIPPSVSLGYFGALTKTALIKYQQDKSIVPAIGYFGPITQSIVKNDMGTSTTSAEPSIKSTTTSIFSRDLTLGSQGDDVKNLQHFLNTHGYPVSSIGAGSLGNETTMFGRATQNALIKYQKDNGIVPSIGYFGLKTKQIIKGLYQ